MENIVWFVISICISIVLTAITFFLHTRSKEYLYQKVPKPPHKHRTLKAFLMHISPFLSLVSTIATIASIILTIIQIKGCVTTVNDAPVIVPTYISSIDHSKLEDSSIPFTPASPILTPSLSLSPNITPTQMNDAVQNYDDFSKIIISDQSGIGFNHSKELDYFKIISSGVDNFGNSYNTVGIFDWPDIYSEIEYVVFYIANYSSLTGQLVAIEGERPSEDATIVIYLDDVEVARFTDIKKTTLPTDFELDLTDCNLLRIETNCQEIMYVNFKFYVEPN